MKISVASDLHLEFGFYDIKNAHDAHVLILAGDIIVARMLELDSTARSYIIEWFRDTCKQYEHVFYIAGNHESYDYNIQQTVPFLKTQLDKHINNLHILDNEVFEYDSVNFLGGTAWTNMNSNDPLTHLSVGNYMNDFQIIRNYDPGLDYTNRSDSEMFYLGRNKKFTTQDAVKKHNEYIDFINDNLDKQKKNVVISHHPLSLQFVHEKYKHDREINGGYCSDQDQLFLDHPEIVLYVCGHCHHLQQVQIGQTTCILNARGYAGCEPQADNFELKTVEI